MTITRDMLKREIERSQQAKLAAQELKGMAMVATAHAHYTRLEAQRMRDAVDRLLLYLASTHRH